MVVAENTFSTNDGYELFEEGGLYEEDPHGGRMRAYSPGERVVACPRCGQRFAESPFHAMEENLRLHMEGDEDIPTLCAWQVPGQGIKVPPAV